MASPFHYFRRHQGYILAVLGVILIVTWVIGPSLESLFQTNQTVADRANAGVVAQWKYGNITRSELTTAGWEHEAMIRFLLAVVERAQSEGLKPQAPFLTVSQDQIDLGLAMRTDDPTLVQIMLFANKGKELGIVIDQQAMMDYLVGLGGYALTEADFYELARDTVAQRQFRDQAGAPLVTVTQLFDRLQLELTALQAQSMFSAGLSGYSTGELWKYHEQLHRRARIRAFPIKVADYKGRFKESDAKEEELRKIYEEGKDRTPDPEMAEPGFRKPLRLAFQYVKVDFQTFLEEAKKGITDVQLKEEYDKQIAAGNFRNLRLDTPSLPDNSDGAPPPKNGDVPAEDTPMPPAGTDPPDSKSGDEKAAPTNEKEKSQEAAEEKTLAPPSEKPCGQVPAVIADEALEKEDQKEYGKEQPTKNENGPAANKETAKAEEPAAGEKAKTETAPAPTKSAPNTEAENSATESKLDTPESKPDTPEFKPLSEVRDQLLNQLARPVAQAAQESAINDVMRAVSDYGTRYTRWTEDKKAGSKSGTPDPGELKITSLAAKHGLTVGKTPLADRFAIAETELGQQAAFRGTQGTVPFASGAFFENRPLFAPQEASSISSETTFVYWRTEQEASEQVPFEKARPLVVAAWMHQQGVEAAKKDAEAIAANASKSGSLEDVLTEEQAKQVVQPTPFSWLSRGTSPLAFGGSPTLSEVKGIPLAGSEFMESVFELEGGQTGVAVDQAHRIVYVVRVEEYEPAIDIRREMFLAGMQAGIFGDLNSYARMASRQVVGDAIKDLREEYQLKWLDVRQLDEM